MITKLVGVGNDIGIIIPPKLLSDLHLKQGDYVIVSETPFGLEIQCTKLSASQGQSDPRENGGEICHPAPEGSGCSG